MATPRGRVLPILRPRSRWVEGRSARNRQREDGGKTWWHALDEVRAGYQIGDVCSGGQKYAERGTGFLSMSSATGWSRRAARVAARAV